MCKTVKRSRENKYQLRKEGAMHKIDRLIKEIDKKTKKNGKRQVPDK